jgi:hypothetical protein
VPGQRERHHRLLRGQSDAGLRAAAACPRVTRQSREAKSAAGCPHDQRCNEALA